MQFNSLKDSGQREEFETGSRRDTRTGKGRFDLISPYFERRLAQVLEKGAIKYGERNWEKGQPLSRYLDSAKRHIAAVLAGDTDEDHAGQAAWNLHAFIHTAEMIEQGRLPQSLDGINYVPIDADFDISDSPTPEQVNRAQAYVDSLEAEQLEPDVADSLASPDGESGAGWPKFDEDGFCDDPDCFCRAEKARRAASAESGAGLSATSSQSQEAKPLSITAKAILRYFAGRPAVESIPLVTQFIMDGFKFSELQKAVVELGILRGISLSSGQPVWMLPPEEGQNGG